jgi:hypothetical protein
MLRTIDTPRSDDSIIRSVLFLDLHVFLSIYIFLKQTFVSELLNPLNFLDTTPIDHLFR